MADDKLVIDPEFKRICPPLAEEEKKRLTINLMRDGGASDPIMVWKTGGKQIIVDGMNRYEICIDKGLGFQIAYKTFDSRNDAINWIIYRQLGRRNITQIGRDELLGKLYNEAKKPQLDPTRLTGGDSRRSPVTDGQNTAKTIGANKASESTVRRSAAVATATAKMPDDVRDAVISGDVKASRDDVKHLAELPKKQQSEAVNMVRNGQAKNLRAAMPAKPPKPGAVVKPAFDEKSIRTPLGQVIRACDARKRAFGGDSKPANKKLHLAALAKLEEFHQIWNEWREATK